MLTMPRPSRGRSVRAIEGAAQDGDWWFAELGGTRAEIEDGPADGMCVLSVLLVRIREVESLKLHPQSLTTGTGTISN